MMTQQTSSGAHDDTAVKDSWMKHEIAEQPAVLRAMLKEYVADGWFRPGAIAAARKWLGDITSLTIAASGSSRHAGMVLASALREITSVHVDVVYASEKLYTSAPLQAVRPIIALSQSGETGDTLGALRAAKGRGAATLAITNAPLSSMAHDADVSVPVFAGVERAIPATKSFTAQLAACELLALLCADARGESDAATIKGRLESLVSLPEIIASRLGEWDAAAERMAAELHSAADLIVLGRGAHYAMACEAALKLKESAYIPADAYPAGEFRHGPIAVVKTGTPVLVLAAYDANDAAAIERHERLLDLMRELKGRGAVLFALANEDDTEADALSQVTVRVESLAETQLALCEIVPLQMLAYHLAIGRGIDVDAPRNLVKSVRSL